MHPFFRLRRLARACRQSSLVLFLVPSLASAATLTGRVVDPDGRGVRDARVIVATSINTVADRLTDATGGFEITALPGGGYEVRVLAGGFQADPIIVSLSGDETRDLSVRLRLSAVTESIVVSAAQVDMPLSRAADSVTVITAAELEARQIETVADALRLVPGLAVVRSGGRGAITSLFPRGGDSKYTLVLVDGIRANAFGGAYDFAHLSVANVDRIEIVRGPQSALFGSDAIGAVVQVVTRRGGRARVEGLVEGGNQATVRATIGAAGSRGDDWTFGGGAEQTRSDGFTGRVPATGETVSNDDYRLSHASGTLGWQRPNGPDLVVSANIGRDERGFPGPFGSNPIGVFGGVDRTARGVNNTRQIGSRFTHPWSAQVRQRLEASYTDLSGDFTSAFGPSSSGTKRFDGRIQEDMAFSTAFSASAGVEFLSERGSSSYITGASDKPIPIERSVTGIFAELRYVGSERLFITGGARLEHLSRDAVEANVGEFSSRPAFPAQTTDSVNPKVAVSYVLKSSTSGASTRLRVSAGTGIRPPDAFEIGFTDNPNLKPERSRSIDAGVDQQVAGGAYAMGAAVFFNRYDQLLVTVGRSLGGASRYQTDNISNARARGVELTGNARFARPLTLGVSYTFLDTEILSVDGLVATAPPPFAVGDALLRRPRHQGAIDLTYASGRLTAFGELTTRSQVLDVEPNFGSFGGLFFTPGYAVVNAGASVRIARGFHLYARVLNLADRAYEETLGFPALRRSAIVGVRVGTTR